jgi:hypothetical protein
LFVHLHAHVSLVRFLVAKESLSLVIDALAKMRKPSTVIEPTSLLRCENTVFLSWHVFDKLGGEIRSVGVSLYLLH